MRVKDHVTRDQIARSPAIVETRADPAHSKKRSWEKEALIIGGVGGLISDLITRDQK